MKMTIITGFSLLNSICLLGLSVGLLHPMLAENHKIQQSRRELVSALAKNTQTIATLKQSLQHFNNNTPSINRLTKKIIQLAKEQQLTIKQIEPLSSDNADTNTIGLAIQTSGSYANTLKFIFSVNQLPFLLHWSTMTLLRTGNDIELTLLLKMSKK